MPKSERVIQVVAMSKSFQCSDSAVFTQPCRHHSYILGQHQQKLPAKPALARAGKINHQLKFVI